MARLLALGARGLDGGQLPEVGHVVLADPEGNEFCVIEHGNSYLAGTGFLGELACDGSREVGLFWSAALDWPLVWGHAEETAIQSPSGGTKVAWGGPPLMHRKGAPRQWLDLTTSHVRTECERLADLGAQVVALRDGGADLLDPDRRPFSLSEGP